MPGINRRAIGRCLFLIWSVPHDVVKRPITRSGAEVEFANGVAHAIAWVGGTVGVAGVRRFGHPDPQESHGHGNGAQANRLGLAFAVRNRPLRKRLPDTARNRPNGILARPILHHIMSGVGFCPGDANAVYLLDLRQVHDHPLRMQRVTLSGKSLGEIGIAFPESVQIAIVQPREPNVIGAVIARSAAARQRIPVGVTDHFRRSRRAGEISFAVGNASSTPRPLRIPVPCLDGEFRILPVGDWLPSGGQSLLERRLLQIFVDRFHADAINSGAQRFLWHEMIRGM